MTEEKRPITAPLRYGGESAYMNSNAINKQCAFRQVSASNPPQRKAANRLLQFSQAKLKAPIPQGRDSWS